MCSVDREGDGEGDEVRKVCKKWRYKSLREGKSRVVTIDNHGQYREKSGKRNERWQQPRRGLETFAEKNEIERKRRNKIGLKTEESVE